jgi:glycine/D-amino acid oxidase-like deaminating enzyme
MNRTRAEGLLLLMLLGGGPVHADGPATAAEQQPSMELLEFLGGFETPEGEWFDPLLLVEQSQTQAETKVTGDD